MWEETCRRAAKSNPSRSCPICLPLPSSSAQPWWSALGWLPWSFSKPCRKSWNCHEGLGLSWCAPYWQTNRTQRWSTHKESLPCESSQGPSPPCRQAPSFHRIQNRTDEAKQRSSTNSRTEIGFLCLAAEPSNEDAVCCQNQLRPSTWKPIMWFMHKYRHRVISVCFKTA